MKKIKAWGIIDSDYKVLSCLTYPTKAQAKHDSEEYEEVIPVWITERKEKRKK